jgi:hypothetical protein
VRQIALPAKQKSKSQNPAQLPGKPCPPSMAEAARRRANSKTPNHGLPPQPATREQQKPKSPARTRADSAYCLFETTLTFILSIPILTLIVYLVQHIYFFMGTANNLCWIRAEKFFGRPGHAVIRLNRGKLFAKMRLF